MIDLWYKRYVQAKAKGEDIKKAFYLSSEVDTFMMKMKKIIIKELEEAGRIEDI